jgi:hypothetical protein
MRLHKCHVDDLNPPYLVSLLEQKLEQMCLAKDVGSPNLYKFFFRLFA